MSRKTFSFEPHLRRVLVEKKPASIVEWGPGLSTMIMMEICPGARIDSIEHSKKWLRKWERMWGKSVGLHHVSIMRKTSKYAVYPAKLLADGIINRPDLCFIDGRRRMECLVVACAILSDGGVGFVHDAERWTYRPFLKTLVDIREDHGDTVVFTPRKELDWPVFMRELKALNIP